MNVRIANRPNLIFSFGPLPSGWESCPGLCASLEALDGMFLLLSLHQYPQALVACTSAIELLLTDKVAREASVEGESAIPPVRIQEEALRGTVPLGHAAAAERLFGVAFPQLEQLYRGLHGFEFRSGLHPDLRAQLLVAEQVRAGVPRGTDPDVYCQSLSHAVRRTIQENFMAPWQVQATHAREQGEAVWDAQSTDSGFALACPVCGLDVDCSLEFEDDDDEPEIRVERMKCQECGFRVSPEHRPLSAVLFEDQLETHRETILREYGMLREDVF